MNDTQSKPAEEKPPLVKHKKEKHKSGWGEFLKTMIWALAIALLIRSLLFQPFNIPSSSMKPTLLIGDYLFVSKFSYGYSRHSFPFSPPLFDGRSSANAPKRGDVVVFKLPYDNRTDFIKRVIGLPGDTISVRNGQVILNNQPIKKERVADFVEKDAAGNEHHIPRYRETLPSGHSYMVLDAVANGPADNVGEYIVPEGHYFMMGDNRDNSSDSRMLGYVGYVPHENLVGPALVLFFSFDAHSRFYQIWRWPTAIRYNRLFELIE